MNTLFPSLFAGIMLAVSVSASAGERHDRHYRPDYRPQHHYNHHPQHHDHHHGGWGVLGAGLALGALAVALEPPRPAPIVVAPPAPPARPVWYYCDSARAYYPYAGYCPEGWRVVPAY